MELSITKGTAFCDYISKFSFLLDVSFKYNLQTKGWLLHTQPEKFSNNSDIKIVKGDKDGFFHMKGPIQIFSQEQLLNSTKKWKYLSSKYTKAFNELTKFPYKGATFDKKLQKDKQGETR